MPTTDTIAAIATPPGVGGLGVVRISGPQALAILERLFEPVHERPAPFASHHLYYGRIVNPASGAMVDEVLVTYMAAPRTYTREDVVEISGHGGGTVTRQVLQAVLGAGARLATPGEFTLRAFLNGRLDLAQAEAVLDIVHAKTEGALSMAVGQLKGGVSLEIAALRTRLLEWLGQMEAEIGFPDEVAASAAPPEAWPRRIQDAIDQVDRLLASASLGRLYRDGATVVITGKPNAGKSSLLNALVKEERAIVTTYPGTTRDRIDAWVNMRGVPVCFVDTAGLRLTQDPAEARGVAMSREALKAADLVLCVMDRSRALDHDDEAILKAIGATPCALVLNKADLPQVVFPASLTNLPVDPLMMVETSTITGEGMRDLEEEIVQLITAGQVVTGEGAVLTNLRHIDALTRAKAHLQEVARSAQNRMPLDFLTIDVRAAVEVLGEITGETLTREIIDHIFSQFCIGK